MQRRLHVDGGHPVGIGVEQDAVELLSRHDPGIDFGEQGFGQQLGLREISPFASGAHGDAHKLCKGGEGAGQDGKCEDDFQQRKGRSTCRVMIANSVHRTHRMAPGTSSAPGCCTGPTRPIPVRPRRKTLTLCWRSLNSVSSADDVVPSG